MKIAPFKLERYFARYEFKAPWLMCSSDCESLSLQELLALEPGSAEALQQLWLGYTESQGSPRLRAEIAGLYEGITHEQVLVHAGAEEAIFNAMNVILEPGDHVVVHSPCYQSLAEVALSIGCQVSSWQGDPTRGWALDLDDLRRLLTPKTRLVVLNTPHNPTGWLMPRDEFQELASLADAHGFRVFSDEVYRLLEFDPAERLPAMCELAERGISLGVMSKSFGMAGLRIGWLATRDRALYDQLAAFKDYTSICNSAPSEFLAEVALRQRDQILQRNLGIIRGNLELLGGFFARFPERFTWQPPLAGPIAFPAYLGGAVDEYCQRLVEEAGVLLLPGTLYKEGSRHFRIGFGRQNLPEALEQWLGFEERQRIPSRV
jgi:aspartate/methionine/tyrosine aminotransferase